MEQLRPDMQTREQTPVAEMTIEEYLGPFYGDGGLARRLDCSVDTVAAMAASGELVAVPTTDGAQLYPVFQFIGEATPHPDMPTFVAYLRGRGIDGVDSAMHLLAMANPYADHADGEDRQSTIALIHAGRVDDAIRYWEKYYKVLEGPSGWY